MIDSILLVHSRTYWKVVLLILVVSSWFVRRSGSKAYPLSTTFLRRTKNRYVWSTFSRRQPTSVINITRSRINEDDLESIFILDCTTSLLGSADSSSSSLSSQQRPPQRVSQGIFATFVHEYYCQQLSHAQQGPSCLRQKDGAIPSSFIDLSMDIQLQFVQSQCPDDDYFQRFNCLQNLLLLQQQEDQGDIHYEGDTKQLCASIFPLLLQPHVYNNNKNNQPTTITTAAAATASQRQQRQQQQQQRHHYYGSELLPPFNGAAMILQNTLVVAAPNEASIPPRDTGDAERISSSKSQVKSAKRQFENNDSKEIRASSNTETTPIRMKDGANATTTQSFAGTRPPSVAPTKKKKKKNTKQGGVTSSMIPTILPTQSRPSPSVVAPAMTIITTTSPVFAASHNGILTFPPTKLSSVSTNEMATTESEEEGNNIENDDSSNSEKSNSTETNKKTTTELLSVVIVASSIAGFAMLALLASTILRRGRKHPSNFQKCMLTDPALDGDASVLSESSQIVVVRHCQNYNWKNHFPRIRQQTEKVDPESVSLIPMGGLLGQHRSTLKTRPIELTLGDNAMPENDENVSSPGALYSDMETVTSRLAKFLDDRHDTPTPNAIESIITPPLDGFFLKEEINSSLDSLEMSDPGFPNQADE